VDQHTQRNDLGLPALVHRHFDELLGRFGFRSVSEGLNSVRYESSLLLVEITGGGRTAELGFTLDSNASAEREGLSLEEML
jgi:hypothetical protein